MLNMVYTLRFFSLQNAVFHKSNVFGSCIIHILYTGVQKLKKNNSGAKSLMLVSDRIVNVPCVYLACLLNASMVLKPPLKLKNIVAQANSTCSCRRMRL